MKQIFTFLIMLIGFVSQAQTLRVSTNTEGGITTTDSLWFTHNEYVNYVFGNLDMQEVSTNFLLERSLSPFEPEAYDGKNSNDIIRSVSEGLGIYTKFFYSALDTSASYAPAHPSLVREWGNEFNNNGYVPIILLNHAYHSIKPNALVNGLFTTNIDSTILYDNPSRTVSPYQQNRAFVAGPYIQGRSYASNGDENFTSYQRNYILPIHLPGKCR